MSHTWVRTVKAAPPTSKRPGTDAQLEGTYAASKRSIEIVADTSRLELAPFGVGVLEVVTGAIRTRGQTYFDEFKLPEHSLYKSIEGPFANRAQGNDQRPRMDAEEYARAVVDAITKRTTGRFWHGINAESTRMATTATAVPQSDMVRSTRCCVLRVLIQSRTLR